MAAPALSERRESMGSVVVAAAVLLLSAPAIAYADWTAAGFIGTAWTRSTTLTLDRGALGQSTFSGVPFDSHSFEGPLYYGYRGGWFRRGSVAGIEGEVIHLKVFARPGALGPDVRRFSISHGLNLLFANAVFRRPLAGSGRVVATARLGAGFSVPHGESEIGGVEQQQYEVGSLALQAAGGAELRLAPHLRGFAEYKLTRTAPDVSVAGGSVHGRYLSQHLAAGLGVAW
jgi:lipid A oxidase